MRFLRRTAIVILQPIATNAPEPSTNCGRGSEDRYMKPERPATSGKRSNAALREFLGIANVDFLSPTRLLVRRLKPTAKMP
jgi:hypothetical protein